MVDYLLCNYDAKADNFIIDTDGNLNGWLNKYVHLFKKENIFLELGCGRAYCSKYLLENGFKNIIASDFSNEAIKIVKKEVPNLKTIIMDMSTKYPFEDDSINVIIADLSLHYFNLEKTKHIFDEIYRVLKEYCIKKELDK